MPPTEDPHESLIQQQNQTIAFLCAELDAWRSGRFSLATPHGDNVFDHASPRGDPVDLLLLADDQSCNAEHTTGAPLHCQAAANLRVYLAQRGSRRSSGLNLGWPEVAEREE